MLIIVPQDSRYNNPRPGTIQKASDPVGGSCPRDSPRKCCILQGPKWCNNCLSRHELRPLPFRSSRLLPKTNQLWVWSGNNSILTKYSFFCYHNMPLVILTVYKFRHAILQKYYNVSNHIAVGVYRVAVLPWLGIAYTKLNSSIMVKRATPW